MGQTMKNLKFASGIKFSYGDFCFLFWHNIWAPNADFWLNSSHSSETVFYPSFRFPLQKTSFLRGSSTSETSKIDV